MRLLQKLEISLGIAFLLSNMISLFVITLPLERSVAEIYNEPLNLGVIFLLFILPPLLVAICSYFHAVRKSYIALVMLLIISGAVSFYIAALALISGLYSQHLLIGTLPFFMGFATMVVAVVNTLRFVREDYPAVAVKDELSGKLKLSYRLELCFGAGAFFIAAVRICYEFLTHPDIKTVIIPMFLIVFLPLFLVFVGAYIQTIRRNDIGLVFIFPGFLISLFFELVSGRLVEIVQHFYYSGMFIENIFVDIPYLLIFITTIFALNSLREKYRLF